VKDDLGPQYAQIIGGESIANKGLYEFNNVELRIKPGTDAVIQIKIYGLSNYGNDMSALMA